jgi:hypothetical protein
MSLFTTSLVTVSMAEGGPYRHYRKSSGLFATRRSTSQDPGASEPVTNPTVHGKCYRCCTVNKQAQPIRPGALKSADIRQPTAATAGQVAGRAISMCLNATCRLERGRALTT